jgi:signal transduction histidine kinase/ActR/RegA family two-component response regulator
MQIRKRLQINAFVSLLSVVIIAMILFIGAYRMNNAFHDLILADRIMTGLFQQNALLGDYLRTDSDKARTQLIAEHQKTTNLIKTAAGTFIENNSEQRITVKMVSDDESIKKIFSDIVGNRERSVSGGTPKRVFEAAENKLLTQLNIRSYNMVLNIQALRTSAEQRFVGELRRTWVRLGIVIMILVAMIVINSLTTGRFIINRIKSLRQGSMIVGEGNLDHRIQLSGDDEFAEFARSFDLMTEKLNKTHFGLEQEISERRLAEEALRKNQNELEIRVDERTRELRQAYDQLKKETEERQHAEGQLRRMQKLEALGTLAGGIAHDFNNILAGIIGFAEMVLEDAPPGSPEHRRIGLVLKGAYRGRDLVRQILTFSRQAEHDKKPLLLSSIVEETMKLLRPTLPSTIKLVYRNPDADGRIFADTAQMHQVVMNLCTNAAHAMRDKGGIIDIEITHPSFTKDSVPIPEMAPGDYVTLKVSDTGTGMELDVQEQIFDPFFTTKKEGEGTGLGLSVTYGIIKDHGGYISVDSKPGKGSTFSVHLPRIEDALQGDEEKEGLSAGGRERILFIDDEDMLAELNKQRLSRLGYEVVTTTSSLEGLRLFREAPDNFDLIITDQTMPNLTGLDLAAEILKLRPDAPIILCTGHSDKVSPEVIQKSGIKLFLMKPIDGREMAEAVRNTLNGNARV